MFKRSLKMPITPYSQRIQTNSFSISTSFNVRILTLKG
jgi:hypothetical protein